MADFDPKYVIPHRLDDPPKFLWWDFDVAILAMGCLCIGILVQQTVIFTGLGVFIAMSYQKVKSGRHRAFGMHALYWYLPFRFGFKITPPSSEREFIG